jgi:3-isopropylmalate/(R)-2-methylmalate dehydratase small subunit
MRIEGRCFRFGSRVTTDDILPGCYLDRAASEVGRYAMSGSDPGFASRVTQGAMIVAGPNFGVGSGRELAPASLKAAGVCAIIAPSFGRLFFRNCINLGLPALVVDAVDDFLEGDALLVDLTARTVENRRSALVHPIHNLTGISRQILDAGGIVAFVKSRRAAGG